MDNREILDQFLEDLAYSSESTRADRGYYAKRFLDFIGDVPPEQWDKRLVQHFMRQIEKEGYAAGTKRKIYAITRRVFAAAREVWEAERAKILSQIDPHDPSCMPVLVKVAVSQPPSWPMRRRDGPVVGIDDVVKPALSEEEIEAMIGAAKDGRLTAEETAFLAVATIYGLRREELRRITAGDIDYDGGTIFIRTAKGGDPRTHRLASEIVPYLGYKFNQGYSLSGLSQMYLLIEYKAGVSHQDGAGWHSPRRRLDSILMDRLSMPAVKLFLRWKVRTSSDMPLRYYSKELEQNDRDAFGAHPFLGSWRCEL